MTNCRTLIVVSNIFWRPCLGRSCFVWQAEGHSRRFFQLIEGHLSLSLSLAAVAAAAAAAVANGQIVERFLLDTLMKMTMKIEWLQQLWAGGAARQVKGAGRKICSVFSVVLIRLVFCLFFLVLHSRWTTEVVIHFVHSCCWGTELNMKWWQEGQAEVVVISQRVKWLMPKELDTVEQVAGQWFIDVFFSSWNKTIPFHGSALIIN